MKIDVGTLMMDGDKFGVVRNVIIAGTWNEEPLFNWTTSYEIAYFDGTVCVMTDNSFRRLMSIGKIEILG